MPAADSAPMPVSTLELKKPEVVEPVKEIAKTAPTIKELEADEPLLQENPHRFVLFPLKYHEIWQSKSPKRATRLTILC